MNCFMLIVYGFKVKYFRTTEQILRELIMNSKISFEFGTRKNNLSSKGINRKFILPTSPHMDGWKLTATRKISSNRKVTCNKRTTSE